MNSTARRGALKALLEVVLIVVGVLIALALEESWQDRADREAERALLASLRDEFRSNAAALAQWRGLHERIVSSSAFLIDELADVPDGDRVLIADSLLANLARTPTYTPALNSLDAALSSGQIILIRSAEVQQALANWTRLLQDAQEEETRSAEVVYSDILPHLAEVTDLGPGLLRLTEDVKRVMARAPREPWPATTSRVVASRKLRNLVWIRYRTSSSAANELGILEAELERILALLESMS